MLVCLFFSRLEFFVCIFLFWLVGFFVSVFGWFLGVRRIICSFFVCLSFTGLGGGALLFGVFKKFFSYFFQRFSITVFLCWYLTLRDVR